MHRCQVHKLRNILEHLPDGQRPWVRAIVTRAYKQAEAAPARRLLQDLARRLEDRYPSAAASVREGLDETLTVLTLGLFRSPAALTRDDERHREPDQPHPPCEAERQTMAWRPHGVAVDRRRRPRSRRDSAD
jgi:hypothetical protein